MNPPCYVLCDANNEVGYGHFFRTKYLVNTLEKYRNWQWLWCGSLTEHIQQQVAHYQPYENIIAAAKALQDSPAGLVIVDSYVLQAADYAELSLVHTVIVFDDFAPFSYADVFCVINFCVAAPSYPYQAQHQLLGATYFVTHPQLQIVQPCNKLQSRTLRILIAMGGFDRLGVGRRIAEALVSATNDAATNIHVTLLDRNVAPSSAYHVVAFCDDMPSLYQQADVVISGGGLTKYESAYAHIPNVVIAQTAAQFAESKLFAQLGLCINYGLAEDLHDQTIIEFVDWFMTNDWQQEQANIAIASMANFDQESTINVAQQLLTWLAQDNE